MTIQIGIIGSGSIGRVQAEAAARAGSRVVGCCDLSEVNARELAADFTGALATTDPKELLAIEGLDAVVVAVPNAFHRDCAIQAMEAGCDVLLEKPMALDLSQCDDIIAAAGRTGRLVQLGFVCRCSPAVHVVEKLIETGRLGQLYHARATWLRRRGIPGLGGWFTTKSRAGGGALIDLGVHMIDLVIHLASRPAATRVSGVCTSVFGPAMEDYVCHEMWGGPVRPGGTFDVEDGAVGLIRFGPEFTLELSIAWAANIEEDEVPPRITLLGDRGGVQFELWADSIRVSTEQDGVLMDVHPRVASPATMLDDAFAEQHAIFARNVRDRTSPGPSMADGREVQAILDAMYRSSEAGMEVEA